MKQKSKKKSIILILVLIILIPTIISVSVGTVLILSSMGIISFEQKEPEDETKITYIDSFEYSVVENESTVINELSYTLSFDIGFSMPEDDARRSIIINVNGKKEFRIAIESSNTEDVRISSSSDAIPYVSLTYNISKDVTYTKTTTKLKITTKELIDDINNFLTIDCYDAMNGGQIVDEKQYTSNLFFKINYSADTGIFYEFNDFSESYKIMSVISNAKVLELPSTYKNYPIKEIDEFALSMAANVEELTLPSTLAFLPAGLLSGLKNLTSLSLPYAGIGALDSVELGVLFDKENPYNSRVPQGLKSITITGKGSIGDNAFSGCKNLENVVISQGVTGIGINAFSNCTGLTNITIPDGITSIGDRAFRSCTKLTSVTIPNSVTGFGEDVFKDCIKLEYTEYDNGFYLGSSENPYVVFAKAKNDYITTCEIHTNTRFISSSAFYACRSLESITIPEGITFLGNSAFYCCNNLESIAIPKGITTIGDFTFYACYKISNITIPNIVTSIGESAFQNCTSLDNVILPEGVLSIGDRAFEGCSSLKSIEIPNSLTSMGMYVFLSCSNLQFTKYNTGLYLGNSSNPNLVLVEAQDNLKSIEINNNTKFICSNLFSYCPSLEKAIIPKSVISIGYSAFCNCEKLKEVYYIGSAEDWDNIYFGRYYNSTANDSLTSENIYYYSEEEPIEKGNYWHYVEGIITKW